ncbi:MAG: DUF488 family protein [Nitrosospira sp.]
MGQIVIGWRQAICLAIKMKLGLKRAYEPPLPLDGVRILVDRLWPRGLSKTDARIDFWAKEIAPSNALRHWYQHEFEKWPVFRRKYMEELRNNDAAIQELIAKLEVGNATLLFDSQELNYNNAMVLKEYLESLRQEVRRTILHGNNLYVGLY